MERKALSGAHECLRLEHRPGVSCQSVRVRGADSRVVWTGLAVANLRRAHQAANCWHCARISGLAAALGLPGATLKAYAFVLSSAIAGVGGVIFAFAQPTVLFNGTTDNFLVFAGIIIIAMTVAGGVGLGLAVRSLGH